jgi:hypothetical protein
MSIDGDWMMTMNTPMGQQKAKLSLQTDGNSFTGMQTAEAGSAEVEEGAIDGDKLSWTSSITKPMPLTLKFNATVTGNEMAGAMSVGFLGTFPFKAVRS